MRCRNAADSNVTTAKADWPPVVVGGAHQTGVNLMRNLARRGVRVSCVSYDRREPGFHTVYGRAWECPHPDDDSVAWSDFMTLLSQRLGRKPVLIAGADAFVSAMARHARVLSQYYTFCDSSAAIQSSLTTKKEQYEVAAANAMPIPLTRVVKTLSDVEAFAAEAQFPCFVKPPQCREWARLPATHPQFCTKVALAKNREELIASYLSCREYTPELIAQK